MRKNKLFIFMSILTLIFLFGTAALIDQCTLFSGIEADEQKNIEDEPKEEVENTEPDDEIAEEADKDESGNAAEDEEIGEVEEIIEETQPGEEADETEEAEESPEKGNQPPVVTNIIFPSAIILPGNTYYVSAVASDPDGDDLYYEWGVSAGTIDEWEGWDQDHMKWTTPNEEVTVAVTVRVYDGIDTSARTEDVDVMFQQVEVEVEETEKGTQMEMQALLTMEFPLVWTESGGIRFNRDPEALNENTGFGVGDSRLNEHIKSFASYDISNFQGGDIKNVTLTLKFLRQGGSVSSWDSFDIYVASWGPRPLVNSDYHLLGTLLASYPVTAAGDIICDTPMLKQKLLEAIEKGSTRFQVIFYFNPALSDNNNLNDGWTFTRESNLKITYEP